MASSRMLLPRLRQRMLHIGHNAPAHVAANIRYLEEHAPPGQEADIEGGIDTLRKDDGPNPPWMWNTFYVSSVELGLLKESQARNFNLVVPTNSDSFSTVDITKSFVSVCNNIRSGVTKEPHTTSLPAASSTYNDAPVTAERPLFAGMDLLAESVLKPYVTCLDGDTIGRFNASTLVSLLKCLHELPIGETTGSTLGLKNFLIGHLVTYSLEDLCSLEVSEILLIVSKMGKSSSHCNPEAVSVILKHLAGHPEVAGPTSAALSRFSHHFPLPTECEDYFEYAHAQAMQRLCGAQHRMTVLRAMVELGDLNNFTEARPEFSAKMAKLADELLETIKEDGLIKLEGANIGMIFQVFARRRNADKESLNALFGTLYPQVRTASCRTITSVSKNSGYLGVDFPPRLAEAFARRAEEIYLQESLDSAFGLLQGVGRIGAQSPRARKIIETCLRTLLETHSATLTSSEFAALTRALALGFGRYRSRGMQSEKVVYSHRTVRRHQSPLEEDAFAITHELDPLFVESILTLTNTIRFTSAATFNDVLRNLVELDLHYDELRPFIYRVYDVSGGSGITSPLFSRDQYGRFLRTLHILECTDIHLLRALKARLKDSNMLLIKPDRERMGDLLRNAGIQ